MTHILIPIKDIENRIKIIENVVYDKTDSTHLVAKLMNDREKFVLKHWLSGINNYKQISLDEKDVEEKALNAIKNTTMIIAGRKYKVNDIQLGYEQALKDLL